MSTIIQAIYNAVRGVADLLNDKKRSLETGYRLSQYATGEGPTRLEADLADMAAVYARTGLSDEARNTQCPPPPPNTGYIADSGRMVTKNGA